jgi:hypothetical protein
MEYFDFDRSSPQLHWMTRHPAALSQRRGLVRQVLAFLFYLSTVMFEQSVSIVQSLLGLFFCISVPEVRMTIAQTQASSAQRYIQGQTRYVCRERLCHEV